MQSGRFVHELYMSTPLFDREDIVGTSWSAERRMEVEIAKVTPRAGEKAMESVDGAVGRKMTQVRSETTRMTLGE